MAEHAKYSDIDLDQMESDADVHGWVSPRKKLALQTRFAKSVANIKNILGALWNN